MKAFLVFLEVMVKLLIAVATGIGFGLLTFGGTLMARGGVDFDSFGRTGPPPAESFLSAGVALLAVGLVLVFLFVGPGSRRRWFLSASDAETDKGKPPMVGGRP